MRLLAVICTISSAAHVVGFVRNSLRSPFAIATRRSSQTTSAIATSSSSGIYPSPPPTNRAGRHAQLSMVAAAIVGAGRIGSALYVSVALRSLCSVYSM